MVVSGFGAKVFEFIGVSHLWQGVVSGDSYADAWMHDLRFVPCIRSQLLFSLRQRPGKIVSSSESEAKLKNPTLKLPDFERSVRHAPPSAFGLGRDSV